MYWDGKCCFRTCTSPTTPGTTIPVTTIPTSPHTPEVTTIPTTTPRLPPGSCEWEGKIYSDGEEIDRYVYTATSGHCV